VGPIDPPRLLSVSAAVSRRSISSAACDHSNPAAGGDVHANHDVYGVHANDVYGVHANDVYGDGYDDIYVGVRSRAQTRRPS
jgi:hypothetical protein